MVDRAERSRREWNTFLQLGLNSCPGVLFPQFQGLTLEFSRRFERWVFLGGENVFAYKNTWACFLACSFKIHFKTFLFTHQPEPFFITFAIYDVKERRKISEDFHVNPNEPEIQAMIPAELLSFCDRGGGDAPEIKGLPDDWISKSPRQVGTSGSV